MKKRINITITKGDREKAKCYYDEHCLLGTALRRMRYKNVIVFGFGRCEINGVEFKPVERFTSDVICEEFSIAAPFYRESVVGMKVTLVAQT